MTIFHEQEGYPITSLCYLLDLPRSSCYYAQRASNDRPVDREENELRQTIEAVASEFATYGNIPAIWDGSRRVTQELRRRPYEWMFSLAPSEGGI